MPIGAPLAASPRRELDRERRVPDNVKTACLMMIEEGLGFATAAEAVGLKPDSLRRHLHKLEVIGFLRREGARFRMSVVAANTAILQSIRDDQDGNQMARVNACRELARDEEGSMLRAPDVQACGITIVVEAPKQSPIDVTPRVIDAVDAPASDEGQT
jgi:hypothetical protein